MNIFKIICIITFILKSSVMNNVIFVKLEKILVLKSISGLVKKCFAMI